MGKVTRRQPGRIRWWQRLDAKVERDLCMAMVDAIREINGQSPLYEATHSAGAKRAWVECRESMLAGRKKK